MVSSTPNPIRLQTHSKVAVKAAKAATPLEQSAPRGMARALSVFYACVKATMASFKASHPKRHDLTLARTRGERRSLDVRAHLRGPWKLVVKKINVSSGPSKEIAGLKKMMMMMMMMKMMTPGSQDSRV